MLVSLTLALRQMCDALWPGMASEGGLLFKDLTSPPVILQTLSTPFGTAGAILPLAIFFVYLSVLELSAGGELGTGLDTVSTLRTLSPTLRALWYGVRLTWTA